jgi:hypothetical protein
VDRGGQGQQRGLAERRHVPAVDPVGHLLDEPGAVEQGVGLEHVADLLPGRLHVAFLVEPDDLGADAGSRPVARVGVELAQPRWRPRSERVRPDVVSAVDRGRHGFGVGGRALDDLAGRQLEQLHERFDPGLDLWR